MIADPFSPFETARLTLRCVALEDAAGTSALMTPEVSRWVARWPMPFTRDMAVARIESARVQAFQGDALPLAIITKIDKELIGWVVLSRDDLDNRRGSLGYWLGERYHGKGYMKEAAPVALAAGFALLNLDVIESAAQPGNAGSFSVMQSCGMQRVGDGMVYAPARQQDELCTFYEVKRLAAMR
ncbi:GNAT family N-acetyltransferase [Acidisoma cladoniae]|jgi:ribosomal-protein-alanine N-acetyltransferase|uniref:GNAT family N-acetyltransferase n=1 Tax=Acidisoma cladoniae TaxID=3040935 RepID=UPI00254AD192|nr:GNAT family N-acetyltransferase [Acidisoma sp. PAMC 29798]